MSSVVVFWVSAPLAQYTPIPHGLTVAPGKSQKIYTHLRNATESAGGVARVTVCSLCSRISLCGFCVAKKLHYRVATCVKNIQKTERVKHDLRNILIII